MKGVILAGGTGSRLYPLTLVTNKHLLPLYNEPMIYKVIKTLRNSGINDIIIVLGGESVGDFVRLLKDGSDLDVHLTYLYQQGSGGIAEALFLTKNILQGNKIAVILGDNIFEYNFKEVVDQFEKEEDNISYLFLKEVEDPHRFGVATVDKDLNILKIVEKPKEPESNYAVTGLYFYPSDIFEKIQTVIETIGYSNRGELEITDVNNLYIKNSKVKSILVNGFWSDAGEFETLLISSNFIRSLEEK